MDKPVRSWKVLLAVGLLLPPLAYIAGALASHASDPEPRDAIVITTVDADIAQEPQTVLRPRDDDGEELRDCDDDDGDDDDDSGVVRPCLAGRDFVDDDGDLTDDVSLSEPATETVDRRPQADPTPGGGGGGAGDDGSEQEPRDRDQTDDAPEPDDTEEADDDDSVDGDD